MQVLTNLDLAKNELQNTVIQNLATYPPNPKAGQIFFHTGDKTFYGYTGAAWIDLGQVLNGTAIVALINTCSSIIDDDNLSTNVADALLKRHSHSNLTILNAMEVAFTNALKTKLDGISTGANKVAKSTTNGNILVDGTETNVYTHPGGSGTNPHGTTMADVGISSGSEANKPTATGSGKMYLATDTKKIWKDTASGTWTQMGGQDLPIATANVLGGIKIGANLTITEDGILNGNDNPASFIIKHERFTISGGQTSFTLTKGTYKPGTKSMFWFLNGEKQDSDALTETSSTVVGIPSGLSDGNEVMFEYFEIINANPFPYHASQHISTGVDPIPDATDSQDGLMSAADKTKLNGIATGAQTNQNAFSNVKVGTTTVSADNPTDTIELVAGTNVVLTPDATLDKLTIALGSGVETTSGSQAKANAAETNAKAYADTKIAAIVNSAPGTLDTLNELATALGDDPNFATTITNLINTKARKFTAAVGNGTATTFNVTHNFNTLDTTASLRETSSGSWVIADIQTVDANTIKIVFATAPTSGQYKLTVTG